MNILVAFAAAVLCFSETAAGSDGGHLRSSAHRRLDTSEKLDGSTIPKYVTDLVLPPVLWDDGGKPSHWEMAFRQFSQQVLPPGYPATLNWGYGDPARPGTFNNPSFTIEVTRNVSTTITWRNELVVDPVACKASDFTGPACNFLPHVLQDRNGVPIVDQSLHWANPGRNCKSGENKTDCEGASTEPYLGPVPIVVHVHGSHTDSISDGYAEGWWLPKASNIPAGYSTEGSYFRSRFLPTKRNAEGEGNPYVADSGGADKHFAKAAAAARGQGYAVFRYTNDQDTCTLFYHDHAMGMTRLNVYAGGAGFWLIRDADGRDNNLAVHDASGKYQRLPGPPIKLGDDPNGDIATRSKIREIPIAIEDKSYFKDGRQFWPATRASNDFPTCSDGGLFGDTSRVAVPYRPNSDIPLLWIPEVFHDTFVVNGNTFPKFKVAPERYRFRIVNACDSRQLNLALKIGSVGGTELPLFVIGTEQGLLPKVVKVQTGFATPLKPGKPTKEVPTTDPATALLMHAGERYDIIVDFAGLASGTEVFLINTGPRSAPNMGEVLKFIVDVSYSQPKDVSTSPYNIITTSETPTPLPTRKGKYSKDVVVRDLALTGARSQVCVRKNAADPCTVAVVNCSLGIIDPLTGASSLSYGPVQAQLGYNARLGPGKLNIQRWMDPIQQNPKFGATEIWEFWNWSPVAHPIHLHAVQFTLLGRYDFAGKLISNPLPYELYKKDTVTALATQVTRIQVTFDISGYFVWHCHMTSHMDNEMMVPFCVGRKGKDCPSSLF